MTQGKRAVRAHRGLDDAGHEERIARIVAEYPEVLRRRIAIAADEVEGLAEQMVALNQEIVELEQVVWAIADDPEGIDSLAASEQLGTDQLRRVMFAVADHLTGTERTGRITQALARLREWRQGSEVAS